MQWNKTFGGSREDEVYSIQPGSDNGYVMVGRTEYVSVLLNDDVWIISIDASGNMLWDNSIGGNGNDWAFSSYLTSDGGHAIAGVTTSYGAGGGDAWLIKIDKDGHEQWNKTFGETKWDEVNSVQQTSDGGYILTGITGADTNPPYQYLIGGDAWLIKTDAIGNRQWSKKFGGRDTDWTVSVQQTTDDGYILAGATESYGTGGEDVWLIKTDEKGNEKWSRTFGGKSDDFGLSVQQTLDGGYLIVGTTESYGAGGGDVWLIKLSSEVTPTSTPMPTHQLHQQLQHLHP